MAEPISTKAAAGSIAASSGAGAALAGVKGWVLELLGVPLPVVLAAATGAFGARYFMHEAPFWRGLGASLVWTLVGSFATQAVGWAASIWISAAMPAGALALPALVVAGAGQWVAPLLPELAREAVEALRKRLRGGGP